MLRSVSLMSAPPPLVSAPPFARSTRRSRARALAATLCRAAEGAPPLVTGMGQWTGTVAIATVASAAFQSGGLGFLTDVLGASAGASGGRGLGNAIAGALGAGPGDVSVSMPSSVAKGSGQPAKGAGAKGQLGAPGGGVGADRANQLKDALDQYNRENLLAENGEGGTSGMGGHEGASGTGEAQQMGEMPEWAGDVAMCMVPLPMGSLKLLGRLAAGGGRAALVGLLRARALQQAGFWAKGVPVILDENLAARGVAEALRARGFNVRSVVEIFGRNGIKDPVIREFAESTGARVLTADRGRQMGEGFGSLALQVDARIGPHVETLARILSGL